jgi:hypothetical protein
VATWTKKLRTAISRGRFVSVDPSCGSSSSQPGYAIYDKGVLVTRGLLEVGVRGDLHTRLHKLATLLRMLRDAYEADTLVYEDVPPRHYGRGGGNANAHASLLKSVGTVLSLGWENVFGIRPTDWKWHARDSYVKGDAEDAEEIGYVAIELATGRIEKLSKAEKATRRRAAKKKAGVSNVKTGGGRRGRRSKVK